MKLLMTNVPITKMYDLFDYPPNTLKSEPNNTSSITFPSDFTDSEIIATLNDLADWDFSYQLFR